MTTSYCLLRLPLGECFSTFNFEKAVCNHGFFMMAPNLWFSSTKTLVRPLRLVNSTSITVSISHSPSDPFVVIKVPCEFLPPHEQKILKDQVMRMLRISDKDERDVRKFQQMHPEAKEKGFGRLFRSPSLFEDAVKTILLCGCHWKRSLDMAQALCALQSELPNATRRGVKRKREANIPLLKGTDVSTGNFPTSRELANLDEKSLESRCNLGYRAKIIINLAKRVENGSVKLNTFEEASDTETCRWVYKTLLKIHGFGPFICANILMCIGFYEKIPIDSETIRLVHKAHGKESCKKATIREEVKGIYDKYAPFQCLAYWLELLRDYENKLGKLSELPGSSYHSVTGSLD